MASRLRPDSLARRVLGISLAGKLLGATCVVAVGVTAGVLGLHGHDTHDRVIVASLIGVLAVSLGLHLLLVAVALRPLRALEATAARIAAGDDTARVPDSPLADATIRGVGTTVNWLLDRILASRARTRQLAAAVIAAQDQERARLARELHESAAQALAALTFQASAIAAAAEAEQPALAAQVRTLQGLAREVMDELREVSYSVYPQVLDDLGLPAALRTIARQVELRTDRGIAVRIEPGAERAAAGAPRPVLGALYRVTEQAVANAVAHAGEDATILVTLAAPIPGRLRVMITDTGAGFDADRAITDAITDGILPTIGGDVARGDGDAAEAPAHTPLGLFTMRERLALVGGTLDVVSRPGAGTQVAATVTVPVGPVPGVPVPTAR